MTPPTALSRTPSNRPTGVRHRVIALATLMSVSLYLDRNCLGFLERTIREDLCLSNEQNSFLLSAFFWTYALVQVPSGWLSDRFGARRMLTLYIVGWSVCTGVMGLASSFAGLVICRFGSGLAQAGAFPTCGSLLSRWAPLRSRAWASAIVATGGRVGGAIAPVLTAGLMLSLDELAFGAWRAILLIYGIAGLYVALSFWLDVRERPSEHTGTNAEEQDLIQAGKPPASVALPRTALPLGPMLRSRSLWLSSLAQFGTNFGWVFLLTWFPRYLTEVHHVPVGERGTMATLPMLLGIGGMLTGGWITDRLSGVLGLRWGRCLPTALSRFVGMAAFVSCAYLPSAWSVTAALCVMAIATDLGVPAIWAFMQDIGGRHVGSVLGWSNMWGNFGAAVSPLVLNAIVGAGHWQACFWTCAAAFLISGLAALGIDSTRPLVAQE